MVTRKYANDLLVGAEIDLGTYFVARDEVVSFAKQWDPLDFHIDEELARQSRFGELIGCGVHTMAIFQRLATLGVYRDWAVIAGRSINDVQLTAPLRPETTVSGSLKILAVDLPPRGWGTVKCRGTLRDEKSQLVSFEIDSYVEQR